MSDIVTLNGYKIKDEKAVRSYESIAQMKADTKLKEGYHVKTKGYYEANDGGNGEYIIVDDETLVDDGGSIHALNNGLRAKLIFDGEISSIVFGDVATSENDSPLLQKMFDYVSENKIHLKLRKNKIYNIGNRIKINSNLYLDMNESIFKMNNNTNDCFLYNMDNYTTQTTQINNITIKNGTFDGNSETNYNDNLAGMCLILYYGNNINLENLTIYDCERNAFNTFETSNISFKNILFKNICRRTSSYITGGNYCINLENRNGYEEGSQCTIKNITLDGCGGHFIHSFKYSFCNIDNLDIINPYDNSSLHSVNLTYTASKNCNISNVYVEGTAKNFCEVNQGSENIKFSNIKVASSDYGFVFGPNTDTSTINKNIYIEDSDITSTSYVFTYNYSSNCYFSNCKFNGGLGGADTNASNLYINNCDITTPVNKLFVLRRATITNSKLNEYLIKSFAREGNIDITVNFELTASGSTTISLPMLTEVSVGARGFKLSLTSWFPNSTNQMYQALYLYNISSNNSDIGSLSTDPIAELGSTYRKIVPSTTTHNVIDIATTSDTALGCQLHLFM